MIQKFFHHEKLRLAYHDIGFGAPVILLHGFTMNAKANWIDTGWVDLLLQAGKRVIALDARGHGNSDKPYDSRYYPSNLMMEDSIELMNQLNIDQADFIGFSMGARMATFAAIKYPQRLKKLVIGGMGINLIHGTGNPKPIAEALLADNIKDSKDRIARRFRRLSERQGNDLKAMAYCISSSRQKIAITDLNHIQSNTLIIVGDKDEVGGNPFQLCPHIPNAIAQEIKHCNHFNAITHQEFKHQAISYISD